MTAKITGTSVDASTGEVTERELTADEVADFNAMQLEIETAQAEKQAKADARTSALAKLADLGLTQDEINAL